MEIRLLDAGDFLAVHFLKIGLDILQIAEVLQHTYQYTKTIIGLETKDNYDKDMNFNKVCVAGLLQSAVLANYIYSFSPHWPPSQPS